MKTAVARRYQLASSPVVSTRRMSGRCVPSGRLRRATVKPREASSRATESPRSWWRGTRARKRFGNFRRSERRVSARIFSSPGNVLPPSRTGASGGMPSESRTGRKSRTGRGALAASSNLILPVTRIFSGSMPSASQRGRSASSCRQSVSSWLKIGAVMARARRKRFSERCERRVLARMARAPMRLASQTMFGQTSASMRMRRRGRMRRTARRAMGRKSRGL